MEKEVSWSDSKPEIGQNHPFKPFYMKKTPMYDRYIALDWANNMAIAKMTGKSPKVKIAENFSLFLIKAYVSFWLDDSSFLKGKV